MSPIHSLAPETLAHIFDYLPEDSKKSCSCPERCSCLSPSLCCAALVCRAWRDDAQRALFGTVYLGNFSPKEHRRYGSSMGFSRNVGHPNSREADRQAQRWLASPARIRYGTKHLILTSDMDAETSWNVLEACSELLSLRPNDRPKFISHRFPFAGRRSPLPDKLKWFNYSKIADVRTLVLDQGSALPSVLPLTSCLQNLSIQLGGEDCFSLSRKPWTQIELSNLLASSQGTLTFLKLEFVTDITAPEVLTTYFGTAQFVSLRYLVISYSDWERVSDLFSSLPSLEVLEILYWSTEWPEQDTLNIPRVREPRSNIKTLVIRRPLTWALWKELVLPGLLHILSMPPLQGLIRLDLPKIPCAIFGATARTVCRAVLTECDSRKIALVCEGRYQTSDEIFSGWQSESAGDWLDWFFETDIAERLAD